MDSASLVQVTVSLAKPQQQLAQPAPVEAISTQPLATPAQPDAPNAPNLRIVQHARQATNYLALSV